MWLWRKMYSRELWARHPLWIPHSVVEASESRLEAIAWGEHGWSWPTWGCRRYARAGDRTGTRCASHRTVARAWDREELRWLYMAGRLVWVIGLPGLASIEDKLEEGVTSIRDRRLEIHQFFSYVLTPGLSLGILNMRLDTYLRTCLLESLTVNLNKQDPCIGNSFEKGEYDCGNQPGKTVFITNQDDDTGDHIRQHGDLIQKQIDHMSPPILAI